MKGRTITKTGSALMARLVRRYGNQRAAAVALGISQPTLRRWIKGHNPIPAAARELAAQLVKR